MTRTRPVDSRGWIPSVLHDGNEGDVSEGLALECEILDLASDLALQDALAASLADAHGDVLEDHDDPPTDPVLMVQGALLDPRTASVTQSVFIHGVWIKSP